MESAGKRKCEVLKDIRKKIADANGIKYTPCECHHEGECAGTCPRCEQEMRYIESEIEKKKSKGKKISIAAATIGTVIVASSAFASCGSNPNPAPDYELEGDSICTPTVDSAMIGTKQSFPCYDDEDSIVDSVYVTITSEMVDDNIYYPDSSSALWKAIEDEKLKLKKK